MSNVALFTELHWVPIIKASELHRDCDQVAECGFPFGSSVGLPKRESEGLAGSGITGRLALCTLLESGLWAARRSSWRWGGGGTLFPLWC